jgi:hypothetical protein
LSSEKEAKRLLFLVPLTTKLGESPISAARSSKNQSLFASFSPEKEEPLFCTRLPVLIMHP